MTDRLIEYIMAHHYGWTIEDIRNLRVSDFYAFSNMAMLGSRLKNADIVKVFSMMMGARI